MPMPKQLAQIPILRARHPYAWKAIFHQQLQQQFRFQPVILLYALAQP